MVSFFYPLQLYPSKQPHLIHLQAESHDKWEFTIRYEVLCVIATCCDKGNFRNSQNLLILKNHPLLYLLISLSYNHVFNSLVVSSGNTSSMRLKAKHLLPRSFKEAPI